VSTVELEAVETIAELTVTETVVETTDLVAGQLAAVGTVAADFGEEDAMVD
jgi:hypothetical protein